VTRQQKKTYHSFATPRNSSSIARMPLSTSIGIGSSLFTVMRLLFCTIAFCPASVNFDSGVVILAPKSILITTFSPLSTRRTFGHTMITSIDTATPIVQMDRSTTWTVSTENLLVSECSSRKRVKLPHAHLAIGRIRRIIRGRFKGHQNGSKYGTESCSSEDLVFFVERRRQATGIPRNCDRQ
jgi:hypothetical protein